MVVRHLPLVPPIAHRIHRTLPPSFDIDDLISIGHTALVVCANRFRPREYKGVPFSGYAAPRIHWAIFDSTRRGGRDKDQAHSGAYGEHTRIALEDAPEPAAPAVPIEITIDHQRLYERARGAIALLTPIQAAVCDLYYSPEMPSLAAVAARLKISEWRAGVERIKAIESLRSMLGARRAA